jgi:hypothetical protein
MRLRVLKVCRETLAHKDLLGIQDHRALMETQDLRESRGWQAVVEHRVQRETQD